VVRRSGLGKGLGALIPTDITGGSASELREVPVGSIEPNPNQPRNSFDEESLTELTASIAELGVLQPLLVQEVADERFRLIAGERRWRAARRAGLQVVPVLVRDLSEVVALEAALVENLHRDDLNPLEEASAYQQLLEDFGLTQDKVAQRVGRSRSAVANTLRLLLLPPSVQKLLAESQISAGHAKALLGTPDRMFQEELARRIAAEGLSVRDAEEAVRRRNEQASGEPEEAAAARTVTRLRPPGLLELEELLAEHLDTRVRVQMGTNRGKVTVEFATLEDLERIYRAMTEGRPA
jgi:ParB family chromosome partitioning protein